MTLLTVLRLDEDDLCTFVKEKSKKTFLEMPFPKPEVVVLPGKLGQY